MIRSQYGSSGARMLRTDGVISRSRRRVRCRGSFLTVVAGLSRDRGEESIGGNGCLTRFPRRTEDRDGAARLRTRPALRFEYIFLRYLTDDKQFFRRAATR